MSTILLLSSYPHETHCYESSPVTFSSHLVFFTAVAAAGSNAAQEERTVAQQSWGVPSLPKPAAGKHRPKRLASKSGEDTV